MRLIQDTERLKNMLRMIEADIERAAAGDDAMSRTALANASATKAMVENELALREAGDIPVEVAMARQSAKPRRSGTPSGPASPATA